MRRILLLITIYAPRNIS